MIDSNLFGCAAFLAEISVSLNQGGQQSVAHHGVFSPDGPVMDTFVALERLNIAGVFLYFVSVLGLVVRDG
jgi:hypothetical protein